MACTIFSMNNTMLVLLILYSLFQEKRISKILQQSKIKSFVKNINLK